MCSNCRRLNRRCVYGTRLHWKNKCQFTVAETDSDSRSNRQVYGPINEHMQILNFSFIELSVTYQMAQDRGTDSQALDGIKEWTRTEKEDKWGDLLPSMEEVIGETGCVSDQMESFLFHYFEQYICGRSGFCAVDDSCNQYLQLIVPRLCEFKAMDEVVMALSALDICKTKIPDAKSSADKASIRKYYCLYVNYLNASMTSLYEALDHFDPSDMDITEKIVITLTLLCTAYIGNRGDNRWHRFLSEVSAIFSMLTEEEVQSSQYLSYAYRYFSLRFILLIATLKSTKFHDFMHETSWPMMMSFFTSKQANYIFGCSPRLLYGIYTLVVLDNTPKTEIADEDTLENKYNELWDILTETDEIPDGSPYRLELCSQCYRLTAQTYFCICLSRASMALYRRCNFKSIYEVLVVKLVDKLTEVCRDGDDGRRFHFPCWCLFVRCNCPPTGNRDEVRRQLFHIFWKLEQANPMGSILSIRKAVEVSWKVFDLSAHEPKIYGRFDFRHVLEKYGFMLALT